MNLKALSALALLPLIFTGCATKSDPVAKLLQSNGQFAIIRPPSDREYLGDVYRTKNLIQKSIAMRDVMSESDLDNMMAGRKEQVSIPSSSGNSSFKLSAEAAFVGVASGDLEVTGAKNYSVTVTDPVIYDSPLDSHLASVLVPSIKSKFPKVSLQGKYIVRSLLQVGGLEYEFHNDHGGKINLGLDKKLLKNLTAKLGTEWKVTGDNKLVITKPRFIGYRLAQIDSEGGPMAVGESPIASRMTTAHRPSTNYGGAVMLSDVAADQYDNRDLRERRKKSE